MLSSASKTCVKGLVLVLVAIISMIDVHDAVAEKLDGWLPTQNVSNSAVWSGLASLTVDSGNGVHLVWIESTESVREVYYSSKPQAGEWANPANISSSYGSPYAPSIAVSGDGTVHVVWADHTLGLVYVSKRPEGTWSSPSLIWGLAGVEWADIAVAADNNIHVAFYADHSLYYISRIAGTWSTGARLADAVHDDESPLDIAVDTDYGRIHIVWWDGGSGKGVVYYISSTDGTVWSSPQVLSTTNSNSVIPRLAIVGRGAVVDIVWWEMQDGSTPPRIVYRQGIGMGPERGISFPSAPEIVTDAEGVGWPAIALDYEGCPYVVWQQGRDIFYSDRLAGTWAQPQNISNTAALGVALAPAIAIDTSGTVHVAWQEYPPSYVWQPSEVFYSSLALPKGSIKGQVFLQGRASPSAAFVIVFKYFRGHGQSVASDGSFKLTLSRGRWQVVTSFSPTLRGRYLVAVRDVLIEPEHTILLPTVMLLGGDVNGDGNIDISDLATLAAHFNTASDYADINGDGRIDVYDLALMGLNFGKSESPWPGDIVIQ